MSASLKSNGDAQLAGSQLHDGASVRKLTCKLHSYTHFRPTDMSLICKRAGVISKLWKKSLKGLSRSANRARKPIDHQIRGKLHLYEYGLQRHHSVRLFLCVKAFKTSHSSSFRRFNRIFCNPNYAVRRNEWCRENDRADLYQHSRASSAHLRWPWIFYKFATEVYYILTVFKPSSARRQIKLGVLKRKTLTHSTARIKVSSWCDPCFESASNECFEPENSFSCIFPQQYPSRK